MTNKQNKTNQKPNKNNLKSRDSLGLTVSEGSVQVIREGIVGSTVPITVGQEVVWGSMSPRTVPSVAYFLQLGPTSHRFPEQHHHPGTKGFRHEPVGDSADPNHNETELSFCFLWFCLLLFQFFETRSGFVSLASPELTI